MSTESSPPSFPQTELHQALTEQSFGIKSFEITETSQHEACARICLLEGTAVQLSLTSRGFQGPEGQTYETAEDALQAMSPLYLKAKQNELFTKLAALAAAQDDQE